MKNKNTLWFTRQQNTVRGPFVESVITDHLVLGRLSVDDEVSIDQHTWHKLSSQDQLLPDLNPEQSEIAKKRLDERDGFDRRDATTPEHITTPQRRKGERRNFEANSDIQHRQHHTLLLQKIRQRKNRLFWPLVGTFSTLTAIFMAAALYPERLPVSLADCNAPASPAVNWTNCLKPQMNLQDHDLSDAQLRNVQLRDSNLMNTKLIGADLAYADLHLSNLSYSQLQNAILVGTDLKKADLSYADLSNADLSYADLSNANLGGSQLDNARLDYAIWINGQVCAAPSIGECIIAKTQTP